MTNRERERWAAVAILVAAWVLPAACTSTKGQSGVAEADTASKASRSPARASVPRTDSSAVTSRTVLFVGTSLTAGLGLNPDSAYPQLVQEKIEAAHLPFDAVNAGVSGETTAGLLRRLDWLMRANFDVIVIESGANDGLRGTPVATIRENLRTIVSRVRAGHPNARIVLVQMEAPPNMGPEYTAAFHRMYADVARASGATLMPFLLQGVAGNRDLNQNDGIHPNQRGEHIVADNVWRTLEPVLSGVARAAP
jgi:acyl-CoA thioesterase-1